MCKEKLSWTQALFYAFGYTNFFKLCVNTAGQVMLLPSSLMQHEG